MNSPKRVFVITAMGPQQTARIFGSFSSEKEAEDAIIKLAAKLLLYHSWEHRPWHVEVDPSRYETPRSMRVASGAPSPWLGLIGPVPP